MLRFLVLVLTLCFTLAAAGNAALDQGPKSTLALVYAELPGGHGAYASGVIVGFSSSGLRVATAAHIAELPRLAVITQSGEMLSVTAVHLVPGYDLAILQTSATVQAYEAARPSGAVAENEAAQVWGYGADTSPRMVPAVVVGTRTLFPNSGGITKLAIACDRCDHGDSGAGVFSQDGALIGFIAARWHDRENRLSIMEGEPAIALGEITASK